MQNALSHIRRNGCATLRIVADICDDVFHVRDEPVPEAGGLLVVVPDAFLKLSVRFGQEAVALHRFLSRAREKTSSPSIAVVFPAWKSASRASPSSAHNSSYSTSVRLSRLSRSVFASAARA